MPPRKSALRLSPQELVSIAGELGKSARFFDDNDVRQLLRAAVEREGTQVAFAERHRLDRAHLNQVLKGKGRPSKSLLKCLGLRAVFTFEEAANPGPPSEARSLAPALERSEA
jgi:hypothetical protein